MGVYWRNVTKKLKYVVRDVYDMLLGDDGALDSPDFCTKMWQVKAPSKVKGI